MTADDTTSSVEQEQRDVTAYDHGLRCRACGPGYTIGCDGCRHGAGYKPVEGETGICRTCLEVITFCTKTDPGYLPRTGWRDGFARDALVCFKSANYDHVPLGGREEAIYRRAFERGLKEARRG